MIDARVTDIWIYPVKDEPGRAVETIEVETEGLAGDRRKKAPVHIVSIEDRPEGSRSNLVIDATRKELAAAVGSRLQVGRCVLTITGMPSGCPGVYASVEQPGTIRIAERCITAPPAAGDR